MAPTRRFAPPSIARRQGESIEPLKPSDEIKFPFDKRRKLVKSTGKPQPLRCFTGAQKRVYSGIRRRPLHSSFL